jgi:hypothetical protein
MIRRWQGKRSAQATGLVVALVSLVGNGIAGASPPTDPPGGATPLPPQFNNGIVNLIRSAGSSNTLFLMQRIGDLYTDAGLYGCTLNNASGQTLYNNTLAASSPGNAEDYCQANANSDTTDTTDNWDRTEVIEGVDDDGSTPGQQQLCGSGVLNSPLMVDFARSSKPASASYCSTLANTGYAKDAVLVQDFPTVNASTLGTSTFVSPDTESPNSNYAAINQGKVGPVAAGWLPGDAVGTSTFDGTALNAAGAPGITPGINGGTSVGTSSVAYRLWCAASAQNPITDWGQLTNLGPNISVVDIDEETGSETLTLPSGRSFPASIASGDTVSGPGIPTGTITTAAGGANTITISNAPTLSIAYDPAGMPATFGIGLIFDTGAATLAVGSGYPVGIPIRLQAVNQNSGTESVFTSFAASGATSGTACASAGSTSGNMNQNSAYDPNPSTYGASTDNQGQRQQLENNDAQIGTFDAADFPGDFVDQAVELATTLTIESRGVYDTNTYARSASVNGVVFSAGVPLLNGKQATTVTLLSNSFPTARTLFNIYNSATVRGSTGAFLNWICDTNANFVKGTDSQSGQNLDVDLNALISTTFGFPRLTDLSPPSATLTPADNIHAPNDACQAMVSNVTVTPGSSTVTLSSGAFPVDILSQGLLAVANPNVSGSQNDVGVTATGFSAGTYVVSGGGTGTLTLSNPYSGSTTATETLEFSGVPPVTTAAAPQQ